MKCDCCSRRKGWFEVFEPICVKDLNINLCVACCTQVYKVRDAQKYGKQDEVKQLISTVLSKKSSDAFKSWFEENYVSKTNDTVD